MLSILESVHDRYMLHRDLKPENFIIGRGEKSNQLYLIDFGLSKRYIDKTGKHMPYLEGIFCLQIKKREAIPRDFKILFKKHAPWYRMLPSR